MKRNAQRGAGKATAKALNRLIAYLEAVAKKGTIPFRLARNSGFLPRGRGTKRPLSKPGFILRLYVVGLTPRSTQAVERIKAICERHLAGRYDLAVIDLYQKPHLARQAQVIAAPTLVKARPLPEHRIIGDMADERAVLRGLNVQAG
jgi:circadian clock protein KaiB